MIKLKDSIVWHSYEDKIVVIDMDSDDNKTFEVTGVAQTAFKMIFEDEKNLDEAVQSIAADYGVEEALVKSDIEKFLSKVESFALSE